MIIISWGYSVNVPQNKMAYEVIMAYHLHMPFFIVIFLCFLKNSIRQDSKHSLNYRY